MGMGVGWEQNAPSSPHNEGEERAKKEMKNEKGMKGRPLAEDL